jgi:hypothetical protein
LGWNRLEAGLLSVRHGKKTSLWHHANSASEGSQEMNALTTPVLLAIIFAQLTSNWVEYEMMKTQYCKIKPGMTIQQVEAIMGRKADFEIGSLGQAYFEWQSGQTTVWVSFPINLTCLDVPLDGNGQSAPPFLVTRKGMVRK